MKPTGKYFKAVIAISIITPLLYWIPVAAGYWKAELLGNVFLGYTRGVDYIFYTSLINQTRELGTFIAENLTTTEAQINRNFFSFHIFLGLLARCLNLSSFDIPLLFNIIGTVIETIFFLSIWRLLGFLFQDNRLRFLSFLFIAFSGGFGWIIALLGKFVHSNFASIPADQVYNLGYSTFSSLWNPLWIAAHIWVIWALILYFKFLETSKTLLLIPIGMIMVIIWTIHVYTSIPAFTAIWLILAYQLFFQRRSTLNHEIICLYAVLIIPFLVVLSYVIWTRPDSIAVQVSKWIYSSLKIPIFYIPFGQGFIFILTCFGIYNLFFVKSRSYWSKVVLIWWLSGVLWSTNPIISPFRFVPSIYIPGCIFAAYGLSFLAERYKYIKINLDNNMVLTAMVLLFSLSNIGVIYLITKSTLNKASYYRSESEIEAMHFLSLKKRGVVLSGLSMGARISAFSTQKVYLGNYWATANHKKKKSDLKKFLNEETLLEEKKSFLKEHQFDFIYFGKEERRMGKIDPRLNLKTIYSRNEIEIYKVF